MSFLRTGGLSRLSSAFVGRCQEAISSTSGVPTSILSRRAVITYSGRPPNQNGYETVEKWTVSHPLETSSRWDNTVMGWVSGGDPVATKNLYFHSLDAAKQYCESIGVTADVTSPDSEHSFRPVAVSSYEENFVYSQPPGTPFDDNEL